MNVTQVKRGWSPAWQVRGILLALQGPPLLYAFGWLPFAVMRWWEIGIFLLTAILAQRLKRQERKEPLDGK